MTFCFPGGPPMHSMSFFQLLVAAVVCLPGSTALAQQQVVFPASPSACSPQPQYQCCPPAPCCPGVAVPYNPSCQPAPIPGQTVPKTDGKDAASTTPGQDSANPSQLFGDLGSGSGAGVGSSVAMAAPGGYLDNAIPM